jgi:hypothetical protein
MTSEPFIRQELRPDLTAFVERTEPPDADTSLEELRALAESVVSEARRSNLGLDDDEAAFAGGVLISRSPDVAPRDSCPPEIRFIRRQPNEGTAMHDRDRSGHAQGVARAGAGR